MYLYKLFAAVSDSVHYQSKHFPLKLWMQMHSMMGMLQKMLVYTFTVCCICLSQVYIVCLNAQIIILNVGGGLSAHN